MSGASPNGSLAATGAAVDAVVQAAGPQLAATMERIERRLTELAVDHGPVLARHASATIAAGGKRLRPLLVLIAAGEVDPAATERLVRSAAAVELIHSASLVHDDVLDAAPLRRGAPTVVAAAGRTVATATGDLLFSRAFAELAAGGAGELADVRALSAAASALAAGELLQREDAWNVEVPRDRYLHRCELKTGSLFEAACRLGALAADGLPELVDALALFGRRVGLAFQLLDDVLDVSGPASRTGKARGTDLLDGTVTLPLILARELDPELGRVDLRALATPAAAEALCDRIAATGALDEAKARALDVVAQARAQLPDLPDAQRAALDRVAEGVVERYA